MNSLRRFFLAFSIVVYLLCNSTEYGNAKPQNIQEEARQKLNAWFKSKFTKCSKENSHYSLQERYHTYEFVNVTLSALTSQGISEVERMNGLEYKGEATLRSKYARAYYPKQNIGRTGMNPLLQP